MLTKILLLALSLGGIEKITLPSADPSSERKRGGKVQNQSEIHDRTACSPPEYFH